MLIGGAFGFSVYQKTESMLVAIYAMGFWSIYGVLAAFPKGAIKAHDFEPHAKRVKWYALSGFQVAVLLTWVVVYGTYLIYHFEFLR